MEADPSHSDDARNHARTSLRRRFGMVAAAVVVLLGIGLGTESVRAKDRALGAAHASVDGLATLVRADAKDVLHDDLELTETLQHVHETTDVVDAVIVDHDGLVLADGTSANARRGQPYPWAGSGELLSSHHGHTHVGHVYQSRWPIMDGGKVVGAFVLSVDLAAEHREIAGFQRRLVGGGVAVLTLSFLALFLLVRRSAQATEELADAVEHAAAAQMETARRAEIGGTGTAGAMRPEPIHVPSSSELARLAISIERYRGAVTRTSEATTAELRQNADCFTALVEHAPDLVMLLDGQGGIAYVSPAARATFGRAPDALLWSNLSVLVVEDDRERLAQSLRQSLDQPGKPVSAQLRIHRETGPLILEAVFRNLTDDPSVRGIVCNARDVTARIEAETNLRHQPLHDALTGLPNRTLLSDRVESGLARSRRSGRPLAVFMMDLDGFKLVNDAYGHDVGDRLLIAVSRRLRAVVRDGDTAARLGGDEFVVLSEDLDNEDEAAALATRFVDAIAATPVIVDGRELHVQTSLGVRVSTSEDSPMDILRDADSAMYAAKRSGGGVSVSDERHQATAARHLELASDIRRGLGLGQFTAHYQPIVDIDTGKVRSLEALARWEHPERGMVPPSDFIPICEETGLIGPLGLLIFEHACRTSVDLEASGDPLPIAINVSPRQLAQQHFVTDVTSILARVGARPDLMAVEVTESVMVGAWGPLDQLRKLGLRIMIDDFGTGYSSLSYLHKFKADALKIDRSFVQGLAGEGDGEIVKAMIGMAAAFGLNVIAEGVETDAERDGLARLGVGLAQGYLYARPAPIEQLFPALTTVRLTSASQPTGPRREPRPANPRPSGARPPAPA